MRITNSKDGIRRMTLHVPVRVGAEDLVSALCFKTTRAVEWRDDLPEHPSRTFITDNYRDMVRGHGTESLDYWADDLSPDDDEDEIKAWAHDAVHRAFPEFGGF